MSKNEVIDITIRDDQNLLIIFNKLCLNRNVKPEDVIMKQLDKNVRDHIGLIKKSTLDGDLLLDPILFAQMEKIFTEEVKKKL